MTGATLTRFYGIRVAVFPALTTLFLGLHLFLGQRHGMSVPPGVERGASSHPPTRVPAPTSLDA